MGDLTRSNPFMRTIMSNSIDAARGIHIALANASANVTARAALLEAMHNTLIVVEQARQHYVKELAEENARQHVGLEDEG